MSHLIRFPLALSNSLTKVNAMNTTDLRIIIAGMILIVIGLFGMVTP